VELPTRPVEAMNALAVDEMPPLPPPTEMPSMPAQPRPGPRFTRSVDFAALPTAISCTRLFVASTLQRWGARFLEADAELLAIELVRHSVQACGVIDPDVRMYELEYLNVIHVRLLGFERTIGIEVWDNAREPATLPAYDNREGELHGLCLVNARAKDWGSAVTPRGRVVWAELDVYERTAAGLPVRTRRPTPYPRPAANMAPQPAQDMDFLRRVRDGLAGL
jgi:hypothetical protein